MQRKRSLISIAMATLLLVSLCAVCARTNVSAASPPGKPIASGTGPSVCLLQGSRFLYVFVKGYDGALWYRTMSLETQWWTGGWTSLGGKLGGSPVALSRSPGILTVYVTYTNGAIYEKSTVDYGRTWQGYRLIDGTAKAGTGPASSGWSGREDVFWVDAYGNLWQKSWISGQGWKTKSNLGKLTTGGLTSSPAAESWCPGRIDVAARGADGSLWHKAYQNGWHSWESLSGPLGGKLASGTGPAMSSWIGWLGDKFNGYRLDVFVVGTDGAMWQKTWTAASGRWTNWTSVGACLTASPTVESWYSFIIVYIRGCDGNVWQREYYSGAWHVWAHGMQGPPCKVNCG